MLLFTPLRVVNVTALRDAQKCCFRSISRRKERRKSYVVLVFYACL